MPHVWHWFSCQYRIGITWTAHGGHDLCCPGRNCIELLSTKISSLVKTGLPTKFQFVAYSLLLVFSCCLLILKITLKFGWKSCFYQGSNVMLSKFLCLAALWNWAQPDTPNQWPRACVKFQSCIAIIVIIEISIIVTIIINSYTTFHTRRASQSAHYFFLKVCRAKYATMSDLFSCWV